MGKEKPKDQKRRKLILGPAFDPTATPPTPRTPLARSGPPAPPPPPAAPRPVLGPAFTSPPAGPPPVLHGLAAAQARQAWQASLGSNLGLQGVPGNAPGGGWYGPGPGGVGMPYRTPWPGAFAGRPLDPLGRPQEVGAVNRGVMPLTVNLSEDSVRALSSAVSSATLAANTNPAAQRTVADQTAKAFTQAQATLGRQISTASNLGLHGTAGNASAIGRVASGLDGIGMTRAGTMLSRAAMPIAVTGHVIDTVGQVMVAANDRWATEGQIGRRLLRDLVPGGAMALRQYDAFSGRAAAMEMVDTNARERSAGVQSSLGMSEFRLGFAPQQSGRRAAAESFSAPGAYVAPPVVDRSNVAGEQRYRDEMRLLPYRRETVRLDREAVVARAEEASLGRELVRIESRRAELNRQRGGLEQQIQAQQTGLFQGSGPEYQNLLLQQRTIDEELNGLTHQSRQARERRVDARARTAQAQGAADAARAREQFAAQAENRQERATAASSAAVSLGRMDPVQREMARVALQMAETHGTDAVPRDLLSLGEAADPESFRKLYERAGARSNAFRTLQQSRGGRWGNPGQMPWEVQREADQLREQSARGEFEAEARASQGVENAARGLAADIGHLLEDFRTQTIAIIRRDLRLVNK